MSRGDRPSPPLNYAVSCTHYRDKKYLENIFLGDESKVIYTIFVNLYVL